MKMCQSHWDQMRAAIDQRGLTPLVCADGAEAMGVMKDQVEGIPTRFDPLLEMNWAFMSAAIEAAGIGVMGVNDKGEHYCPLCLAKEFGGDDLDQNWITGCADQMQKHAMEQGLIPGKQ